MWNEMSCNYYDYKNMNNRIRTEEYDMRTGVLRESYDGYYLTYEDFYKDTTFSVDDLFGMEVD